VSKYYLIEAKLSANKWTLIKTETRQVDALAYIKESSFRIYPLRIVRVTRTIVFNGEK
jgi:hypothetical protein